MSLKSYKWVLLIMCLVVVALLLLLPKVSNTKAGNYTAEGTYVCAASGRSYLVMETEEDPIFIVRLYDGTEEENLWESFAHGGKIRVRTGAPIRKDEVANCALVVANISRKKDNVAQEVPGDMLAAVERIDVQYTQ